MELKKHIIDEKTGISYTLCGDYYLPDLALPEEKYYELGRFGRAKFRYLQKCCPLYSLTPSQGRRAK